jgi:hypothetical protein
MKLAPLSPGGQLAPMKYGFDVQPTSIDAHASDGTSKAPRATALPARRMEFIQGRSLWLRPSRVELAYTTGIAVVPSR